MKEVADRIPPRDFDRFGPQLKRLASAVPAP